MIHRYLIILRERADGWHWTFKTADGREGDSSYEPRWSKRAAKREAERAAWSHAMERVKPEVYEYEVELPS